MLFRALVRLWGDQEDKLLVGFDFRGTIFLFLETEILTATPYLGTHSVLVKSSVYWTLILMITFKDSWRLCLVIFQSSCCFHVILSPATALSFLDKCNAFFFFTAINLIHCSSRSDVFCSRRCFEFVYVFLAPFAASRVSVVHLLQSGNETRKLSTGLSECIITTASLELGWWRGHWGKFLIWLFRHENQNVAFVFSPLNLGGLDANLF